MIESLSGFCRRKSELVRDFIWLMGVPFALAQLLKVLGILSLVNGLYGNLLSFWVAYLLLLGVYGAACFAFSLWLVERGVKDKWLVFRLTPTVCKPGSVFSTLGSILVMMFILSGIGLGVYSGIAPAFLLR
jgi:hypothetical protein